MRIIVVDMGVSPVLSLPNGQGTKTPLQLSMAEKESGTRSGEKT